MKRNIPFCLLAALLAVCPLAEAGTKEELVRLQSDVLALQNQIREFDKGYAEKLDSLRSLVIQLNDQVARSGQILDRISTAMENSESGKRTADQSLLEEVRRLSAKVDEASTRISAMALQLGELKVQSASLETAVPSGLSPEVLYNQAYGDFVQGNFDLAIEGFTAYVSTYPAGDRVPDALLNIGDAYAASNRLPQAVGRSRASSTITPTRTRSRAPFTSGPGWNWPCRKRKMPLRTCATSSKSSAVSRSRPGPGELNRITGSKPAAPARRKTR